MLGPSLEFDVGETADGEDVFDEGDSAVDFRPLSSSELGRDDEVGVFRASEDVRFGGTGPRLGCSCIDSDSVAGDLRRLFLLRPLMIEMLKLVEEALLLSILGMPMP